MQPPGVQGQQSPISKPPAESGPGKPDAFSHRATGWNNLRSTRFDARACRLCSRATAAFEPAGRGSAAARAGQRATSATCFRQPESRDSVELAVANGFHDT